MGGARGAYILTPETFLWFDSYIQMLFMVMLLLTLGAVAVSRDAQRLAARARASPRSATTKSRPNAPACRRSS